MSRHDLILASYNVHKGVGGDYRRDPARILGVLGEIGADVLALQEVDRRFGARAGVLDPGPLAQVTGLEPVSLDRRLGLRALGWHGNLLLVRPGRVRVQSAKPLTLPGLEPRGAIVADLVAGDRPLRVIALHLGLLRASRLAQARRLADEIGGDDGRPTVVMGDTNEWRLGPDCGLMPLRRGLRAVKRSAQTQPTFPARLPVLPLDRIIASPPAALSDLAAHASPLARLASDHLPLTARLRLPG